MQSARNEESQNSNYQRDIQNIFRLNKWILGVIGIWPITVRGVGHHAQLIMMVFFNFVLIFTVIPCFLHMIFDQKNMMRRLKIVGLLSFCLTAMIKYYLLTMHRPKILYCIDYVKNDWWQVKFKSDRDVMVKYFTTGRNLTIASATFIYIAGIIYYFILPWCYEHKIGNRTVRPLVFQTYSGFPHLQITPLYEVVYLTNCVCGYAILSVSAGACGLASLFATHACAQIEIIMTRLEDLLEGKNFEKVSNINQRIGTIIKNHVRIISET
ncbi:PREDICTED: uncharacterized protein LOC106744621 isoform X2 [Dinoponera quadriceps]|uniref:Uncharacterized protein LOC106744621 isoform X2 n=1 Tax=Dinoponera quadriceps TaxID=609295 RepID=A0A6P3XAW9_DINQU|nr:PREDICTED: uncharacterized protein LOC106744621 isoform X2 [Dinoponera quadriceps]